MNQIIIEQAASYLKQPYARLVVPETDGTFRAEILEFPGCIASGDSANEALSSLEEVALDWLKVALANGQSIPDPVDNTDFSGRLVLRMPKGLHRKLNRVAAREGVSLNQFIVAAVAEHVGERTKLLHAMIVNTAAFLRGSTGYSISFPTNTMNYIPALKWIGSSTSSAQAEPALALISLDRPGHG